MGKALEKVSQLITHPNIPLFRRQFERIQQMPGAARLLKRIASASDKEQLEDQLAEVRYVLVFAGLGFDVEIEPFGSKGPDLRVTRDSHQAIVEVTRFRKVFPGPLILDLSNENSMLPEYGNPPRDIRKTFEKLLAKFPQAGDEQAIIAIWNDDGDLEDLEVETAVINLRSDAARHILTLPGGLLFVLYGSHWVRAGDKKQLYCFPLRRIEQPHQAEWQHELDTSTVWDLVQRALTPSTGAG